jgi:hypothetical protein
MAVWVLDNFMTVAEKNVSKEADASSLYAFLVYVESQGSKILVHETELVLHNLVNVEVVDGNEVVVPPSFEELLDYVLRTSSAPYVQEVMQEWLVMTGKTRRQG